MKKILTALVMGLILFTSCTKEKPCDCGYVTYKPSFSYKYSYVIVRNYCTSNELEIPITEEQFESISVSDNFCPGQW